MSASAARGDARLLSTLRLLINPSLGTIVGRQSDGMAAVRMLQNFFELNANEAIRDFANDNDFIAHFQNSRTLRHAKLQRGMLIARQTFRDLEFENVQFSHVEFSEVTFTRCKFRDCLFVGTSFKDVQFHSSRFDDCNTYKFKLEDVYFDPKTFHLSRAYRTSHSNVGLETFQSFYRNAQLTHQPVFAASADIQRRKWERYQLWYRVRREWADDEKSTPIIVPLLGRIVSNRAFDLSAKYGYGPVRFIGLSLLTFLVLGLAAQKLWPYMGLGSAEASLGDSLYYSMLLMTTIGFTNAFPVTATGKVFAVICALVGISWFGIFTAILVKRVIR